MDKQNYIIAYDIPDNKRRKKISDLLEGYGFRANYSVFEVSLSQRELTILLEKVGKRIKPQEDSVRYYRVCKNCLGNSKALGREKPPFAPLDTMVD